MIREEVKVREALHARPLDRFVRLARTFASQIRVLHGAKGADGKNVIQLLLLAVPTGGEVTLEVEGDDQAAAAEALTELLIRDPSSAAGADAAADADAAAEADADAAAAADAEAAAVADAAAEAEADADADAKAGQQGLHIQGIPGAPGLGIGLVQWVRRATTSREASSPEDERRRTRDALLATADVTRHLARDDDPFCDIFRAQLALLEDPSLQEALQLSLERGASAEQATLDHFAELEQQFGAMGSSFFRDRHADVADVRDRLLEALGMEGLALSDDTAQMQVLVVREATPSRLATLDLQRVAAVISLRGGATSHAAIVARGRGIPLVFAGADLLSGVEDGRILQVDGETGAISNGERGAWSAEGKKQRDRPPAVSPWTPPGEGAVAVYANLGAPGDLAAAMAAGCDGCGLLRSELLYQGRSEAPAVDEQADAYGRVASALDPRPVVVRLFDAGSDKPLAFLPGPQHEPNPALGLRGLRLLRQHPGVLEGQLEAIALARRETGCDISALVPMITEPGDVRLVRRAVADRCPVGAMIETPAAAALVSDVAAEAAFLSLGTNDLTQYALAADRETGAMAGPHPAVLRLVAGVARAARQAGISCSVCGELAGDARAAPLLAGLGLTLSVAPALVDRVRRVLGGWTREAMEELARLALELSDAQALEHLLEGKQQRT